MANLSEALDHNRSMRRAPKPQLDHLRVYEAANEGHIVEHHMDRYGASEPERHVFEEHEGPKPILPKDHVLTHIAKHMNIPHEIAKSDRGLGGDKEGAKEEE
jgi:hypothetical protein